MTWLIGKISDTLAISGTGTVQLILFHDKERAILQP